MAGRPAHRSAAAHRPARFRRRRFRAHVIHNLINYLVWSVYLVVGVVVAGSHGDLTAQTGARSVVSAVAAVLGWPLVVIR